ncbi:N6-adenine-specific DNA methylase [Nitzschia inconspicua]|uniref:N6-adenine-specific DNA methylase n=1 Tax=Nitzschia inconspicua TaxID=303405 RepID=A0A9K3Q3D6_9STRA|nr:N6-adenine-specific DNA methylase [Nitzschia inconspicua]
MVGMLLILCCFLSLFTKPTVAIATTSLSSSKHLFLEDNHRHGLLLSASTQQHTDHDDPPTIGNPKSFYLATCVPGLAHILQRELEDIQQTQYSTDNISNICVSGNAAVTFEATREVSLYALCWLRSAHRLLEMVATSDKLAMTLQTRDDVHTFVHQQVNIKDLLGDGKGGLLTLSVKAILNNPRQLPQDLSHSHYTALTVKNALCDMVRNLRGDRPDVDIENADVPLVCILRGEQTGTVNTASISLYRSLHPSGSLHKRGYRQGSAIHKAAMKESLAAGLLLEAGWKEQVDTLDKESDRKLRLIDPMAGSGSLILEACMIATDIAPGLMRIRCGLDVHRMPPVTRWKGSDQQDAEELWKSILLDATRRAKSGIQRMREEPDRIQIVANDIHPGAIEIMESALSQAGFVNFVEIHNWDCYDLAVADNDPCRHTIVTTNPPWGVRLTEDIQESWEGLKHFIRNKCPGGTRVYVLSGDKSATGILKLKRDRMIPIQTGDQHLRWVQYTIRGSSDSEEELTSPAVQDKIKQKSIGNSTSPMSFQSKQKTVDLNGWG